MPIFKQITSQKFYSQYRNGETWSLLPNDTTSWLIGLVGEKLKCETTITIAWGSAGDGSPNDGIATSGSTATRNVGSWLDDGFSLGDTILAYTTGGSENSPNVANGATITFVDDTTMIVDTPFTNTSSNYSWIRFLGTSDLEGAFFKFGLIENSENLNFDSKIDNTEQSYSINGLVTAGAGTPLTMNPQNGGNVKAWQTGSVDCTYVSESTSGALKTYKIEHEFTLLPYFVDGWQSNISLQQLPTLFSNGKSLKYVFELDLRKTVNNPNEKKTITQENVLGNVGWFEQNFNGFINLFSISNLQKTVSAVAVDNLIVSETNHVAFSIDRSSGSFLGSENVIVYVSKLPDFAAQTEPSRTFEENFVYDTKLATAGGGAVSSTIIQNLTVTHPGGATLDVELDIVYSSAQQSLLSSTDKYLISCIVGSDVSTFTVNKSNQLDDRAALIVDSDFYQKNTDIDGLISEQQGYFFRHYRDYTHDPGKTDVKGWIEDGYLWNVKFNKFIRQDSEILSANFKIIAYNETTGDWFTISQYDFDIASNQVITTAQTAGAYPVQNININGTRNFNLEATDQFNFAKWEMNESGVVEQHDLLIGFKLNWEEWISLSGVDTVFFDPSNIYGNNGFNKNIYNYQTNGYKIRTCIDMEIEAENDDDETVLTDYRILSPEFEVETYCSDGTSKPFWECRIVTADVTGVTNFNGIIKTDEDTRINAKFTPANGVTGHTYYAVIRLDDQLGNENSIRELSSMATVSGAFNAPSPNSELKPLSGQTGAQITDTGSAVFVDCLIDHTLIVPGVCYKISARLWREGLGEFPTDKDRLILSQSTEELVLSQDTINQLTTSQ